MDPQADSDQEFIVVSTPDCTESASYPSAQAAGLKSSANLFVKSIGLLPSLLGARVTEFQASGTTRTYTRKYSETMGRQIVDQRSVINYNYNIHGGRGGSGGEAGNQGGDGGAGHGPTVYFGQPQERALSGIQTIRLEDINLMKTIRLDPHSDVVGCRSRGVGVRRTYHAEIRRDPGTVTVVMYQGDGAEDEWRQDVTKYESIRHPNIVQLYGLVSTKRLYAMVFHDELIPYDQFLRRFQHSSILTTYIFAYCRIMKDVEFNEASDYIDHVSPNISRDSSVWIRSATGELCLDLAQGGPSMSSPFQRWWWADRHRDMIRLENVSLDAPDSEDMIISSLSEDQYHNLCTNSLIARYRNFQVSTKHPVGPRVFRLDSQYGTCVRITEPLQILPEELHWDNYTGGAPGEPLPNSWIRYDFPRSFALKLELNLRLLWYAIWKAWLAQANSIFAELKEAHVKDYVCIDEVQFILQIANKDHIPEGYLFVCPPQDFCAYTEPHANLYQWPACPAYWSLDPSGADRLSTEDAKNLGFPAIHIETKMYGDSWDCSVYEGLRRFHEGKGYDPESREVARRLGYPLFEVLRDPVPFPAREV
ncbi:MFS general substrate transporter [Mycena sanguinolenta]|uniref:MFS general substrate transporter n=1 Tax=Mycena sanguinolenta TaxID=230812 RepID=A0A8H6Y675_9AGAR|nr:MFS general substrate transporter [Mycena sanguinolenta]